MTKISAAELPGVHKIPQKQNHSLQFPLDDVTILQKQSECSCSWFNRKALKSLWTALKLGQIVIAIASLTQDPEVPYTLFTITAIVVTVLRLGDSLLTARPLRRAFTPVIWFRMELWFTGMATVFFQVLAYYVLFLCYMIYEIGINGVANAFDFVSAGLYLVDWWSNFRKRHDIVQEMYPKEVGGTDQGRKC